MADAIEDVKDAAQAEDVQTQNENSVEVGNDDTKVDKTVYEKVREDMLKYKSEKKEANAELEALKAEVQALKAAQDDDDDEEVIGDVRTQAKVDLLYLIQSDPFVKDNLDLVRERMESNKKLTVHEAIKDVKSDFFDRMQKEVSKSEPEVPPKQIKPKGSSTSGNVIKDALDGKIENADPAQLKAYQDVIARLG